MIDKKEIRAGNWVIKGSDTNAVSETFYVYKSLEDEYSFTFTDHYFPIPLSPDVLGRSSFRHAFGNWFKNIEVDGIDEGLPFLRYNQKTKQWYLFERLLPFQPTFLHQLQNLYFALTNKELAITLHQLPMDKPNNNYTQPQERLTENVSS
ncbi:MAG TPA: hypothetical protein VFT06_16505 [Flavisolibacter sp.]|nr:hypothetical protein [Flavisolibacter sp.]